MNVMKKKDLTKTRIRKQTKCSSLILGFGDNQIQIWDTRNFEKPIVSLELDRTVSRISWSPTRPGLLASVGRDTCQVVLHDIMSWAVGHEDGESSVQGREGNGNFCPRLN